MTVDNGVRGWKKYYGTWRPVTPPHIDPNCECLDNKTIWKAGGCLQDGQHILIIQHEQIFGTVY